MRRRLLLVALLATLGDLGVASADSMAGWSCELPSDPAGDAGLEPRAWSPVDLPDVHDGVDPTWNDPVDIVGTELTYDGVALRVTLRVAGLEPTTSLDFAAGRLYAFSWRLPHLDSLPDEMQPYYFHGVRASWTPDGWRFEGSSSHQDLGWIPIPGSVDHASDSILLEVPFDRQALGDVLSTPDGEALTWPLALPGTTKYWVRPAAQSYDHTPFGDPEFWPNLPSIRVELGGDCTF